MKIFFTSLALLLIPFLVQSQCQVVINEVMFSPPGVGTGSNGMHDAGAFNKDSTAEWVELYNPSSCDAVDISCWVLGSDESSASIVNNGIFVFPQGTSIPPHGFIVVGGTSAAVKDFDSQKSQFYCGSTRWFLSNNDGWVGLFNNKGIAISAVYWSTAGKSALSSSEEFTYAMNSKASVYASCMCSGTTLNATPAKSLGVIEFAGTSSGALGEGWKRTSDGSTTWAKETPNQSTPGRCNGVCAEALKLVPTVTNPANCQDKGAATVTASGGTPPYTYEWSNGSTATTVSNLAPGNYTCKVMDACKCTTTTNVTINPMNISFSITANVTNPLCNGGTGSIAILVDPPGNSYTYKWNTNPVQTTPNVTALPPGDYTVEVTDKGCTASKTITIKQPDKIVIDATTTPATCKAADGSATVQVKGGSGNYLYSWNTNPVQTTATAANLIAGTYIVTVTDANNCTETKSITIEKKGSLIPTITGIDEKCGLRNGSVTITATGGITYHWNTSPPQLTSTAVDLPAGTYVGTVEDANGCSATSQITIKNITTIAVEVSGTPALCKSASGTATVKPTIGEAPFTYLWNSTPVQTTATATNLAPGKYSCEVTDKTGCKINLEVEIKAVIKTLTATTTVVKSICTANNGTAEVKPTSGDAPYAYLWNTNETSEKITALAPGNYWVEIYDKNGCIGKFDVPVGSIIDTLKVIPVVTHETCTNKNGKISTTISGGTLPYAFNWNGINTPTQNLTNISAGDYALIVTDKNGCLGKSNSTVKNIVKIEVASTLVSDHCNQGTGSITLEPKSGQAPYTYLWNTKDTTKILDSLKEGNYTATVKDALGCENTTLYSIENINDHFNGLVLGNKFLQQDEESVLSVDLPLEWKQLYWVSVDGDTIRKPTIKIMIPYPRYGDFTVQLAVISNYGCEEIITIPIYVEPSFTFYIPNCITLNNDYRNDTFFPKYTGISEMHGWVFDRWGQKLYTFANMNDSWDGTYKGQRVQQDVYVYKFSFTDLKGTKHEKIGSITVLKTGAQ
jgi:gliding motility-associated-like protein